MKTQRYDVCIVGAGVAGAMVAYRLGQAGISTLILEAGPRHPADERPTYMERKLASDSPWTPNLPERDVYTNGGEIDYPLNANLVKGVGGSSLRWIGYTPRFHTSDFEMRSRFGVADDWPISYHELEPFYGEAEHEMGVAGAEDNPFASPRSRPYPLEPFPIGYDERIMAEAAHRRGIRFHSFPQARTSAAYRGRPPCVTYGICRACPIRAKWSADVHVELAEDTGHVTVIPDANVIRFEADRAGRVRRAVYATPDRTEHAAVANTFVLAAHAVESARLLLLSAQPGHPEGLANGSGRVGKYFMEHQGQFRRARLDQPLYPHRKGFVTTYSEQFHDLPTRDRESGFLLRGNGEGPTPRALLMGIDMLIDRSGQWGRELEAELERMMQAEYGHTMLIGSNAEPLPSEENRVELDPSVRDHFGNPAPRLFYAISEYERAAYRRGDGIIHDLADELGARSLSGMHYHFGSHQSGTCRMGNDPETSAVDRNLKAHELDNLYVVGGSNFVTLSTVNPTLTIAALALRLGHHLAGISSP